MRSHPLLKGVRLPDRLGFDDGQGRAAGDRGRSGVHQRRRIVPYAFDKKTGKEVWRGPIPYATTGNPMTYRTRSGKQFIVIATGVSDENELVAFTLGGN